MRRMESSQGLQVVGKKLAKAIAEAEAEVGRGGLCIDGDAGYY